MSFLHSYNPVIGHADIKSGNVMLDAGGTAHLSDFGLASARVVTGSTLATAHGVSAKPGSGTPPFMAPELQRKNPSKKQFNKHRRESDVYAFGMFMLESF